MKHIILQLLGLVVGCHGFASFFTTEDFCERPLEPDAVIMNNIAIRSSARSVLVYRLDAELKPEPLSNGAKFVEGETLQVALSDITDEFVFEVKNGAFDRGGCNGKRSTIGGKLKILSSSEPVEIIAGWASGHDVVSISEPFQLVPTHALKKDTMKNGGEIAPVTGKAGLLGAGRGKFAKPLNVNVPMVHTAKSADKKKFLRGNKSGATVAAVSPNFDQLWRQYIDKEGYVEQYITDELINILLVIAVILCAYTFYRVFRVQKELSKKF